MSATVPSAPTRSARGHRAGAGGVGSRSRTHRRPTLPAALTALGSAAAAAAVLVQVLHPGLLGAVAVPVAVTGIVLGVPHGAVDHLVPFWASGRPVTAAALARVLAAYLAVAGLAALALLVIPTATVAVFLVASAVHFGRGEVVAAAERDGRPVPRLRDDALLAAAHGVAVVALPLTRWPATAAAVLGPLAPGLAVPASTRPALTAAVVALAALAAARLLGRGRARDAAELALVVALFLAVPAAAAFGVYFGAWHALRHTARLLRLPGADGAPLTGREAARRYVVHAAAPTAVSLLALALLWRGVDAGAVAVAVGLLLALTFPHVRTVAALDAALAGRRTAAARPPGGGRAVS